MLTQRRIDFFGGLHGNYLELVVNFWIDQNSSYDIDLPQFDSLGACHVKNHSDTYVPITTCGHYSFGQHKFNSDDLVIRIVPKQQDMLIAVTNSFLRAGNQSLDIENLHIDTHNKISKLSKLSVFLQTLERDHGRRDQYPRHVLRQYFYAMFDSYEHGLGMFTAWQPVRHWHDFEFRCFFDSCRFYQALQQIAQFVNLDFRPTHRLASLHQEFLQINQGLASERKCLAVFESIVAGQSTEIQLNIIEEAWLNYCISRAFNVYNAVELSQDSYPTNTKTISEICYNYIQPC